jgi:hypothetical protein
VGHEFCFGRPTNEVQAQHLEGTFRGLSACPQADQQAGNDAEIDLDGYAVGVGGKEIATT